MITITLDEVHSIIAEYIWLTQRPLRPNGGEISTGEIMDGLEQDGSSWKYDNNWGRTDSTNSKK